MHPRCFPSWTFPFRALLLVLLALLAAPNARAAAGAAPTGLAVFNQSGSYLHLTWNAVPAGGTYNIYRGTTAGGEGMTPLMSNVSGTSFNDTPPMSSQTYYYQVTAAYPSGESGPSNEASGNLSSTPLAAPTLIAATGNNQVDLSWSTVAGATGYNVYRSSDGGATYVLYALDYTATAYADLNVIDAVSYCYYVCAVDSAGQGLSSNTVCAVPGGAALPAPTGLTATASTNTNTLNWNAVPGATSYNVYRGTTAGGEAAIPVATGVYYYYSSFTDSNVVSGTTYYYKVTAVNDTGESVKSNEAAAKPGATALAAPVLSATRGSSLITLSWTAVTGATSYVLFRSLTGGSPYASLIVGSGTTYTDSGLTYGANYTYYVCAANSTGLGASSNHISVTLGNPLPAAPTGLTAVSNGSSSIQLTWNAVPGAATYNVYRGTAAGGEAAIAVATGITQASDYDYSLTSGTTYYYKVTAVNAGGEGGKSNEASALVGATALAAPTLTALGGSSQINLSWSAVTGATSYVVFRSAGGGSTYVLYQSGLTGTTSTDTGVTIGVPYSYYVCAVNTTGLGNKSNTITIIAGETALPAPSGLTASPYSSSYVHLTWNAVPGADSYNIYRGTSAGGEGTVPLVTGVTTPNTYDYSGASATTYYYQVTAVSVAGESAKSNEAEVLTGATLLAAPILSVAAGSGQFNLAWSAVSGATTYDVFRNAGGAGFLLYKSGLTGTTYPNTGIANGVSYAYYVAAVNAAGLGNASNTVTVSLGTPALPAPTGLAASPYSGATNRLTWNAVPGATSYNVYRGTATGGEGSVPIATGTTSPSYYDYSATSGTTYYYEVTAINSVAESAKSNEADATSGSTLLTATTLAAAVGSGKVALSWGAITGAASYSLYRSVGGGSSFVLYQLGLTGTSYMDTGVTNGIPYAYYVAAVSGTGQGTASNTVTVIPGGFGLPTPTGLAASPYSSSYLHLTWNPVPGAMSYVIFRGTTAGGESSAPLATGVSSPSYYDYTTTAGTTYYYQVRAVDSVTESARSNEASATAGATVLAAPILAATVTSGHIAISWSSVTGATSYNLYRSVGGASNFVLYQAGLTGTTSTDTAVTNGVLYAYYIAAVNAGGQGTASSTVTLSLGTPTLPAPTGLSAGPYSSSYIHLAWNAVPGAASYNIYRGTTPGGEASAPFAVGVGSASFYDYSPVSGTTYYYKVTAVSSIGESAKSNEAGTTAGATALAAPTLTAAPGSGQIALSWSSVTGATSYNLYRSVDGGTTFTISQIGLTGTTFTDTSLTNGVLYAYYMAAVNSTGQGTASNTVNIALGTPALPAQAGLSAAPYSSTNILLNWNAVPGATSYNIYRGTTAGGEATLPVAIGVSSPSYYDSTVTSGTTYYYKVTAAGIAGESGKSNEAGAKAGGTGLTAPTLTAIASSGHVALSWGGVSGATSYNLYRSLGGGNSFVLYQLGIATTSYTDTAVTNGVPYAYYVAAVDAMGQGANSNTVTAIPGGVASPAPTGLTAAPYSSNEIHLTWNAVPGAVTYNVYRGTTAGGEGASPLATSIGSPSYYDSPLTGGTTYYYKVTALNNIGEGGKSNEASATAGATSLTAPTLAGASGSGAIVLNWSSVTGATSYNLYRSIDNGSTFTLFQLGLTGTTYTDTSLTNGLPYAYYVTAVNSMGQGTNSNTVTLISGGMGLPAPTGLAASPYSSSYLHLTWNPVPGAMSYVIFRGTTAGGESSAPLATGVSSPSYYDYTTTAGTTYYYQVRAVDSVTESARSNEASATAGATSLTAPTLAAAAGSGAIVLNWSNVTGATSYNLYRSVDNGSTFALYQLGIADTTYTNSGLTNGLPYAYYVAAANSTGQGTNSNTVTAIPGGAALPAPTGLAAVASSYVILNWNAVPGATSYNVYRRTAGGGFSAAPYATGVGSPTYYDSTVTSGTAYFYVVTALNGASESGQSNEAEATPGSAALAAPTLSATGSGSQAALSWNAVPSATSYNLYRSIDGGSTFTLYQFGLTSISFTDTGLTNGVPYVYYVCAVNANGQGTASNHAAVTPGSAMLPAPANLVAAAGTGALGTPGVALSWTSVPSATSYNIYSGTTAGGEGTTPIGTSSTPAFNYPYLVNNRTYYFQVTARQRLQRERALQRSQRPDGCDAAPKPRAHGERRNRLGHADLERRRRRDLLRPLPQRRRRGDIHSLPARADDFDLHRQRRRNGQPGCLLCLRRQRRGRRQAQQHRDRDSRRDRQARQSPLVGFDRRLRQQYQPELERRLRGGHLQHLSRDDIRRRNGSACRHCRRTVLYRS